MNNNDKGTKKPVKHQHLDGRLKEFNKNSGSSIKNGEVLGIKSNNMSNMIRPNVNELIMNKKLHGRKRLKLGINHMAKS
jgi:hypothetical protein